MIKLVDPSQAIYYKRDEKLGYRPLVVSVTRGDKGEITIRKSILGPRGGVMMDSQVNLTSEEWTEIVKSAGTGESA